MKYFLLNIQEITYELLIRGNEPAPNVLGLRKQISKLISLLPNDDLFESGLDITVDYEGVLNSITELATRINSLTEKYDYNRFERTKALHPSFVKKINSLNKEFDELSTE